MNNQNIGNEGIENNNFGNMNPTQANNTNTGITFEVPQMQNDSTFVQPGVQVSSFQSAQPEGQMINNMGTMQEMQAPAFTASQPENQMGNDMASQQSGMQVPSFQPMQPENQIVNNMDTIQQTSFQSDDMINNTNPMGQGIEQVPSFTTPQPEMPSMAYNQPQPETITPTFEQPSTQPESYQSEMGDSGQSVSNDVSANPAQNPDEAVSLESVTQQSPHETETVSTETASDSGDKKTGLGFIIGLFILLLIVIIALPYIGKILK